MLFGSKSSFFVSGIALSIGVGAGLVVAPAAIAQTVTTFSDVVEGENRPNTQVPCTTEGGTNLCLNGLGASFFAPAAQYLFEGDDTLVRGDGRTTQGGLIEPNGMHVGGLFPNRFNYGSRGSSQGREGLILGRCDDELNDPALAPGQIPDPCSFFFSDSEFSDENIAEYYAFDPINGVVNAGVQGYGAPVQLPFTGGVVTVFVSGAAGVDNDTELTMEQVCALFNGTPDAVAGVPASLLGATGVHRSDGSGTSEIFTTALATQCNSFGPTDVDGDGIEPGEDLWSYEFPVGSGNWFDRGFGSEVSDESTCGAGGRGDEDTCWPDNFSGGDGNDGVADEVLAVAGGGTPAFGYVELSQALTEDQSLIALPEVINKNSGIAYDPSGVSGGIALATANTSTRNTFPASLTEDFNGIPGLQPGEDVNGNGVLDTNLTPNECAIDVEAPDPTDGWFATGVSYLLLFGDYSPEGSPLQFNLQGGAIRNQFLALLTNPSVPSRLGDIGYVGLEDPLRALVIQTFLNCTRP